VTVLRLETSAGHPAGKFTLLGALTGDPASGAAQGPDSTALNLHTSGTTSRPKIVPLLQSNHAASAQNIGVPLAPADCCLNVMPLFHIHGQIAAVTASLAADASIWCAPGFDALKFSGWMNDARPTWYTAVPTMHQAILTRAPRRRAYRNGTRYSRFCRNPHRGFQGAAPRHHSARNSQRCSGLVATDRSG